MLRRSVGWCEGQLTVLLQPASVDKRDVQALWSMEDVCFTQEERVARQAERMRSQTQIHSRLFNDIYSYVLRTFALLMHTSTLKTLQPPATQMLTRVGLHDVFVHKLVEYQVQFLPHNHPRRVFMYFCVYGGENRTALIDADKSVELIQITGVPEVAYRGTIVEALVSSTEPVPLTDKGDVDRHNPKCERDTNNNNNNKPTGIEGMCERSIGGENRGMSGNAEDVKIGMDMATTTMTTPGGNDMGEDDMGERYRLRFPTRHSSRLPPSDLATLGKAVDLVTRDDDDGDDYDGLPTKSRSVEGRETKNVKTPMELSSRVASDTRHARKTHRALWMRDTLTWAGRNVCDLTLVERQEYLDRLVHDLDSDDTTVKSADMRATHIVLKKVSTFTLADAASVLLDDTPFFQTHLPRFLHTPTAPSPFSTSDTLHLRSHSCSSTHSHSGSNTRSHSGSNTRSHSGSNTRSRSGPTLSLASNKRDTLTAAADGLEKKRPAVIVDVATDGVREEDGDVTFEFEPETELDPLKAGEPQVTRRESVGARRKQAVDEKKAEREDEKEEECVDVRYESYVESRSVWLVPVANSYLVNDTVSPRHHGIIVEPSPIFEIVPEVTILCRTRFRGRLIVCETLETAPGRTTRSSICTLAYAPTDTVHAELSHAHHQHVQLCQDYRQRRTQRLRLTRSKRSSSVGNQNNVDYSTADDNGDDDDDDDEPLPYVCAYLALEPSKRWRLYSVLPLHTRITTAERSSSTTPEIERRLKWISRHEYRSFLRTIR
jgi:hypothetical protein